MSRISSSRDQVFAICTQYGADKVRQKLSEVGHFSESQLLYVHEWLQKHTDDENVRKTTLEAISIARNSNRIAVCALIASVVLPIIIEVIQWLSKG